jgi:hypothetical protein
MKATKIRKSARGEQCQVRIYGVCNHNPDTTVLAHLNGGGMGMKQPDYLGAYACSSCHAWLDGGYAQKGYSRAQRDLAHMEAILRTLQRLFEKNLLKEV